MFQCSSASRKFLNSYARSPYRTTSTVSVLFSEPKIPQWRRVTTGRSGAFCVSVLFSEPKIPQCKCDRFCHTLRGRGFSALQRAENSSIYNNDIHSAVQYQVSVLFSEPKIPQCPPPLAAYPALDVSVLFSEPKIPQFRIRCWKRTPRRRFSALQRAENSSIKLHRLGNRGARAVSVLFSEPKIPQSYSSFAALVDQPPFQCSSASRKFLNAEFDAVLFGVVTVSVLFSEPKIPQSQLNLANAATIVAVSVLFSEPKIPQFVVI